MEIVFTVLILLVAVSASGILVRLLPFPLPLPLVQIAAGALLALPLFKLHFSFDPELFLLLFIPPLLFADGWRTPKREFFLHRRAILLLALGLVLFTVAGVGYFVHWMVPALPLPMAFALAAVLSPTDAVALGAIAGPRRIPRQLMHILEGEALMNDASGLVALKFAIAAALTGSFSMWSATGSFLLIALGGLATGIAMAWMFAMGSRRFAALAGQDSSSQVLLVFLLPFAAYLFAEHFGLSGILSAVAAGMTMNYVDLLSPGSLTTRLQTVSAWETLQYVFNGMVFIILGLQLPHIIGRTLIDARANDGASQAWLLVGYAAAVLAALHALRFLWIYLLRWSAARILKRDAVRATPGRLTTAILTISGVRGSITLAGVLSIPLALDNGTPLPGRDIAVFIAAAVILGSLLLSTALLPLLLRGIPRVNEEYGGSEMRRARAQAALAAIAGIERKRDALGETLDEQQAARLTELSAHLMGTYRRRADLLQSAAPARQGASEEERVLHALRIAGLRAARDAVYTMRGEDEINDETVQQLLRELDLSEAAARERFREG